MLPSINEVEEGLIKSEAKTEYVYSIQMQVLTDFYMRQVYSEMKKGELKINFSQKNLKSLHYRSGRKGESWASYNLSVSFSDLVDNLEKQINKDPTWTASAYKRFMDEDYASATITIRPYKERKFSLLKLLGFKK